MKLKGLKFNNDTLEVPTDEQKAAWDAKQDKLTAGKNISIDNNVISVSGISDDVATKEDLEKYLPLAGGTVNGDVTFEGGAYKKNIAKRTVSYTLPSSYSVENLSAQYGFFVNDAGYYESNNKKINASNSYALCKLSFTMPVDGDLTIELINYAESTYDFGIFSNIDQTLTSSYTADTDTTLVKKSYSGIQSATPTTLVYENVPAGEHFITIKYRKDSSQDANNDSLQFKVVENTITKEEIVDLGTFPLTTREETPVDRGIAYWDEATQNFVTDETLKKGMVVKQSDIAYINERLTNAEHNINQFQGYGVLTVGDQSIGGTKNFTGNIQKNGVDVATKNDIPTVNNGSLSIQRNGSTVATFYANSSSATTANISVPTALSALTQTASYRTVTDTEKTTWNNKVDSSTIDEMKRTIPLLNFSKTSTQVKGDLNSSEFLNVGNYNCSVIPAFSLSNSPTKKSFIMWVYDAFVSTLEDVDSLSDCYRTRKILDIEGNEYIQQVTKDAWEYTYGEWQTLDRIVEQGDGYIRYNNGIQICWGKKSFTASNNGTYTANFNQPFIDTNTAVVATCFGWYDSDYACQIGITGCTTSTFTFRIAGKTISSITWMAINKWK